jgi:hypothetical protein
MEAKNYENWLAEMREEIEESILDSMTPGQVLKTEDLYLGKYRPHLGGYPEVTSIKRSGDCIIVHTDDYIDEDHELKDYQIEELICILEKVENLNK